MDTIAAENKETLSWALQIPAAFQSKYLHGAARKSQSMIFLTHNWLTFLVVLIDRQNNRKRMWFQCEQPFLSGSVA